MHFSTFVDNDDESNNCVRNSVVFVNDFDTIKEMYKLDVLTGRAQLDLFEPRGYYGTHKHYVLCNIHN
jgi:hypothetical protein